MCRLYELSDAQVSLSGQWIADEGAVFDLQSNRFGPIGKDSADDSGLPVLPGLVRYDEVAAGAINHALRFTVRTVRKAYVWPARDHSGGRVDPALPPLGLRLRLKASFDISAFSAQNQVILTALKEYGMILSEKDDNFALYGEPSDSWVNADLNLLKTLTASNFEVVDTTSMAGWVPGYFPTVGDSESESESESD